MLTGVFLLIYLSIRDIIRVVGLLFSFHEIDVEQYWNPQEPETVKESYLSCYTNFSSLCKNLMTINEGKRMARISEIIVEMEIYLKQSNVDEKSTFSGAFGEKRKRKKENVIGVGYNDGSKKKDNPTEVNPNRLYIEIYKQFVSLSEANGSQTLQKSNIDLYFASNYIDTRIKNNRLKHLMGFQLYQLESAIASATFDEDADLKGEIGYIKSEIRAIKKMISDLATKQN